MNILIVYDSSYGNTEKIAEALANAAPDDDSIQIISVKHANVARLQGIDLLIVGSPTQAGRPTQSISEFLAAMPFRALRGYAVAAFDTRFDYSRQKRSLKFLMRTIGYAADKIARTMKAKGGKLIGEPRGFYVDEKEGPLLPGQIEAATEWLQTVLVAAHAYIEQ